MKHIPWTPWLRRAAAATLLALASLPASAATVRAACSGIGQELELCRSAAEAWSRKTGHSVELVAVPSDGSARLAWLQKALAARSDKVDVLQLDVVQIGTLREHLLDLKPYSQGAEKAHFAGMVANGTVNGQLLAMPWFIDAGVLYYRRDLLEKHRQDLPKTWEALKQVAQHIQSAERTAGNAQMWGYVWQGRAYEGLTCDAMEWLSSFGAGTLVDETGKATIGGPLAVQAIATAASWVGTISPPEVLGFGEEEARQAFQSGNAVFMRNWPYAWALAQAADSPIKDKVGIAILPKGSGDAARHAATLGGQQLSVSKYSRNPAVAADLVLHLTSAAVQKERAVKAAYNPTINDLYRDPEVKASNPYLGALMRSFFATVARPSSATGVKYNAVSAAFSTTVHEALGGRIRPEDAVTRLEATLKELQGGGW
ncbi:ABC transporter substrate-binding protein [Aquabacterium sp. A7-Y]|uniref:ABC transporter substrate-binding protein n=1 Tax=Aquabacterium sp. A7-Y TaxID=1349605 RepID=UPI00223DE90D|nr:ABC transporter substrate-binding protein [Aquabacterium sp. A7-Y]MCW7540630.1 ABC transporter substrate-binding protein [Aquabacterium sp. A7-Y]